jgi:hypothetical protein
LIHLTNQYLYKTKDIGILSSTHFLELVALLGAKKYLFEEISDFIKSNKGQEINNPKFQE